MMFLDYEEIIRGSYPILIESYVKQYGEKYREHITNVLERAKYCIFETPLTISEYVKRKINEDFMKAILDSYVDLGIDISNVKIDEDGFVFEDKNIGELTTIFFPVIDSYESIKTRGIFTFNEEYDDLEIDNPIFRERINVLEKLNIKDPEISIEEYIKTKDYLYNCNVFRKTAAIILDHILYRCSDDYNEYVKYADELEEKIKELSKDYEREYLIKIKEYLSDSDKALLDSGSDIKKLKDYYLYFDDSLDKDDYAFADGVLEYFCDCYTDFLIDKHVCREEKEEILDKRIEYLKRNGYDVSTLNRDNLLCDWNELECLKDYLPDMNVVSECLLMRDLVRDEYEFKTAQLCIINDYQLNPLDSEIGTIIESDGHSCSFVTKEENFNPDCPIPVICISPLNDTYNLFDIALDHELRHAIEMAIKKAKDGYIVKMGTDVAVVDSTFECRKVGFVDYNERVTQKLSVEACRERWMNGKFIFSDPYALITTYCISCYDYDLDNLDIIFEPFREELIEAQISPDFNKIYEVIPKNILKRIDCSITNHSKASINKLHKIKNDLLERKLNNSKVKKIEFNRK